MEQHRQISRLFSWIFLALTLLGVILRTVCMLGFFDADVGYFKRGILPLLSDGLYFIAVVTVIVCTARTPKDTLPTELHTPGRIAPALLLGLTLGGFTVCNLLLPAQLAGVSGKATMIANFLALPAAFYFVCSARKNGRYPDWLSLLGFLPVLWCIAAVADTYFDPYVTMNSPVKVAIQLGFLGLMLVLLAELRFRVGKALPRYSVAFLAIGSYACLVGSVPQLCAFAKSYFGKASVQPVSPRYALYAAILLVAGIYGLYLLLRYTAFPPQDAEEASAIIPETDSTQAQ